jgi:hypothetical protein
VDLPPEAVALLALPPARFTAERAAVARALADRGDPAAAAVRKLPRPVGLAWVLNRLSRDHPGEVRALLDAGDRLRAGQRRAVSGAGAGALREAEGAVRERARALRSEAERILAAEGRPPSTTRLARLELLLRVAASGAARQDLAAARLAREPAVGDAGLSGFTLLAGGRLPAPADPGPERPATPPALAQPPARGARAAAQRAAARTARDREREAQQQAARDAREAERRRKERARAVAAEHAAATKATRRAEQAERAADAAEKRAGEARERAAAARAEASRATARALEVERTGR